MVNRIFWTLALALFASTSLQAQVKDTKYWVIPVDSVRQVNFDLADAYEVEIWAGSNIMINAEITLYGASKSVLAHLVEETARYEVLDTLVAEDLLVYSAVKDRPAIKVQGKSCYELTTVKIFIPDTFEKTSDHTWLIREEEVEE